MTEIKTQNIQKLKDIADGYQRLANSYKDISDFYAKPDEFTERYVNCEKTSEIYGETAKRLQDVAIRHRELAAAIEHCA